MKHRAHSAVVAAGLLAVAASGAGCGSNSQHTTTAPALTGSTESAKSEAKQTKARIDQSLVLRTGGTTVNVVVERVIDPLRAIKPDKPAQLDRLVAVKFSLTNVGQAAYRASPSDTAVVIVTHGLRAPLHPVTRGPCLKFSSSVSIAPGRTLAGCVAYDFPVWAKAVKFKFGADAGGGGGEWRLG